MGKKKDAFDFIVYPSVETCVLETCPTKPEGTVCAATMDREQFLQLLLTDLLKQGIPWPRMHSMTQL